MQQPLLLLLLLGMPRIAPAQTKPVVIGETIPLKSSALKESRTLWVAKPAGYDSGAERYPVVYLLDGEEYFRFTATIVDFLGANDRIPKMLVVGIASGEARRRTRDLTPPSNSASDNRFTPGNGGADGFLAFLSGELIPYVDRTYRTRPYRLLAGHSLGGLFGLYTLVTRPDLLNGYILADPSLYWNDQGVVAQAESFFAHTDSLQADFYLASTELSDRVSSEVSRLNGALTQSTPAGFRWKFDSRARGSRRWGSSFRRSRARTAAY